MARHIADRFWSKVDKTGPLPACRPQLGPCWLWKAATVDGYRRRNRDNPQLRAITDMLVSQLVTSEVTAHDVIRCAVLACQLYAEQYGAPVVVRLEPGKP